jgi:hypothetical protein
MFLLQQQFSFLDGRMNCDPPFRGTNTFFNMTAHLEQTYYEFIFMATYIFSGAFAYSLEKFLLGGSCLSFPVYLYLLGSRWTDFL